MDSSEITIIVKQNPDVFELIVVGYACVQNRLTRNGSIKKLSHDEAVIWAAMHQQPANFKFASDDLKNSHNFVLAAVQCHGEVRAIARTDLRNNLENVLVAVQQEPKAMRFASDGLRANRRVGISATQRDWSALQFALGWSKSRIMSDGELRTPREKLDAAAKRSSAAM